MPGTSVPATPSETNEAITVVVNGKVHRVREPDTNRTLLTFLRETLCLTGTKEGCAEGDCGACTVVVTEGHGDGARSRAVNACVQLLPTLHGREVTTVEGLKNPDGSLHPIQQAMVDCHASQCGFCTPGFVMSLHALRESRACVDRQTIEREIAGNLCRCTGYRPIVEAATRVMSCDGPCGDARAVTSKTARADAVSAERLRAIAGSSLAIEGRGQQFWAPVSLVEFAKLRALHPQAKILSGGTDLALTITKKRQDLPALLYIGRVDELKRIATTNSHLEIGAATPLTDAFGPLIQHYPELDEWARRFASTPIRNVGTLGGNIGNGSPIGDSMPVLMALGTSLRLRRDSCVREVALDEFYTGYQCNVLMPGEFIESIRVPLRTPGLRFRAYKISKRFDQDISALCAALAVRLEGGTVADARIALGGMAAVPKRAALCESALSGHGWNEATVRAGMAALAEDFEPISDLRASKAYRKMVAQNLLYKFYLETMGETRLSVLATEN
jgi:xanthine dehydrogenase small subunit